MSTPKMCEKQEKEKTINRGEELLKQIYELMEYKTEDEKQEIMRGRLCPIRSFVVRNHLNQFEIHLFFN